MKSEQEKRKRQREYQRKQATFRLYNIGVIVLYALGFVYINYHYLNPAIELRDKFGDLVYISSYWDRVRIVLPLDIIFSVVAVWTYRDRKKF